MKLGYGKIYFEFSLDEIMPFFKKFFVGKKYQKAFQTKVDYIFQSNENELQSIFNDLFAEMLNELGEGEEKNILKNISEQFNISQFGEIESFGNKLKKKPYMKIIWNMYFADERIDNILKNMKNTASVFRDLLDKGVYNYYEGKKIDFDLLLKEKSDIIDILRTNIFEGEKIISEKLHNLGKRVLLNKIQKAQSDENVQKMVKNLNNLQKQVEEGKMKTYYERTLKVLDNILIEIVLSLKK